MCMLIVGGDAVGSIKKELSSAGFDEVLHWDARKKSVSHKKIPAKVECILMLTSYLSHPAMKKVKNSAKRMGIPSLFAKRSRLDVRDALLCDSCPLKKCTVGLNR